MKWTDLNKTVQKDGSKTARKLARKLLKIWFGKQRTKLIQFAFLQTGHFPGSFLRVLEHLESSLFRKRKPLTSGCHPEWSSAGFGGWVETFFSPRTWHGYIDVGDWCWRRNVMINFKMLRENGFGHFVTKINYLWILQMSPQANL